MKRRLIWSAAAALTLAACAVEPPVVQAPPAQTAPARAWSASALSDLRGAAEAAPLHGLAPETLTIAELGRLEAASRHDARAAAALDAAADGLFTRLAETYARGALDPASIDPDWHIAPPPPLDSAPVLQVARSSGGVTAALTQLLPASSDYRALEAELARVTAEAEGATDAAGLTREQRIDRLRASLEHWRWLPRNLPERRLDVLVPFFEARLVGFGATPAHRVIVGERRRPTPTFQATIQSITLNPSWTPPSSIVTAELLPQFRRNPAAAIAQGFEGLDADGRVVDAADINWNTRPFPYALRQRPGPHNALGRVRFDMPNSFSIYLHDTPSRGLFARADRALSHGCIRVDEPVALAGDVIAAPAWSAAAMDAAIESGATQVVPLAAPLPIYILYMTAIADENGVIKYGGDIYGRDRALLLQLDHRAAPALARASAAMEQCTG